LKIMFIPFMLIVFVGGGGGRGVKGGEKKKGKEISQTWGKQFRQEFRTSGGSCGLRPLAAVRPSPFTCRAPSLCDSEIQTRFDVLKYSHISRVNRATVTVLLNIRLYDSKTPTLSPRVTVTFLLGIWNRSGDHDSRAAFLPTSSWYCNFWF